MLQHMPSKSLQKNFVEQWKRVQRCDAQHELKIRSQPPNVTAVPTTYSKRSMRRQPKMWGSNEERDGFQRKDQLRSRSGRDSTCRTAVPGIPQHARS
ncbi:hypothetical protein GN958_ATG11152 [Phytophthora infestans]|uniref:Uncharacterized protein n=1 Tax=Phytophthora infestans TaxID=4787 RepID=A0A8S9UJL0_PHYIN|nr:hypothetical protein GN958_ATG11152 [Phytophthora infestans]